MTTEAEADAGGWAHPSLFPSLDGIALGEDTDCPLALWVNRPCEFQRLLVA